ncbi:hypothetical protein ACN262_08405 [Burkholderia gladioli]|uniref:hypothetical protein n=1 Tax=Burkholderia gladioli TaxID=28095 RepID=UPI00164083C7|nr:hypothetical protein [Burkholderia gladioli]
MSRRPEFRNEVKTRLTDEEYDAMQAFKAVYGIESDSAALKRIARLLLLGFSNTVPTRLVGVSADLGRNGPAVRA